jgi:hypothetical protein
MAGVVTVVALALSAIATFQPFHPEERQDDQVRTYWIIVVGTLVIAAIVYLLVVPRVKNLGLASVIFGVLALISGVIVYWSGLGFIFGGAAFVLGSQARAGASKGLGLAGVISGSLGMLACAILVLAEALGR